VTKARKVLGLQGFRFVIIGAGTIFRLGEHKLNDFSAGEAKIGEKQSRQSNFKV